MKKLCVVHLNLTIKLIALATANHCRYTSYVRNENEEKYISYNQLRDASKLDEGSQRLPLSSISICIYVHTRNISKQSHLHITFNLVCLSSFDCFFFVSLLSFDFNFASFPFFHLSMQIR